MTRLQTAAEDVASAIVRIPRALRTSSGVSVYDLAARSGYFEQHERVRESVIKQRLVASPHLVEDWLVYSEDKRVSRGWYFRVVKGRQYEVGFYGGAIGEHTRKMYADEFKACAKFIRQEMEEIRSR